MSLAVSEAVTNVVLHAYPGEEPGTLSLEGELVDNRLFVAVIDHGIGMTPNPKSPGLGFGLSVIGNIAQSVTIDSSKKGMSIRMAFPAASHGGAHPL